MVTVPAEIKETTSMVIEVDAEHPNASVTVTPITEPSISLTPAGVNTFPDTSPASVARSFKVNK